MPRPHGAPRFQGFLAPRYTPVPDALFDELLSDLSGAELKVLLYIMRRTLGFKKDRDAISLGQICGGLVTRGGTPLDRGTGLARSTAVVAIRSLEDWGLVVGTRRHSATRGLEASAFQLHFAAEPSAKIEPPWYENQTRASSTAGPPLVRKSHPQETGIQHTDRQETSHRNPRRRPDGPGRGARFEYSAGLHRF